MFSSQFVQGRGTRFVNTILCQRGRIASLRILRPNFLLKREYSVISRSSEGIGLSMRRMSGAVSRGFFPSSWQGGFSPIIHIRTFAETAKAASAVPRGPLGILLSFLPRWGSPGFGRKILFYFVVILIVNGLITVGWYSLDHCYGAYMNDHGKWDLKADCYAHRHQLEIVFNFPGALDFVLDPAPLPPPPSSAYIAFTPVLTAPSEAPGYSNASNPYQKNVDMSLAESAAGVRQASSQVPSQSGSSAGTTPVVSTKPITQKTSEAYSSIYRSTSETIMPFIPVICLYFGDGICPRAYELYKHRDNQDYLSINQLPYFFHILNRMDNSIKWEHRGLYGVLLFNKYMNHSFHCNLVNLDFSYNYLSKQAFKAFVDYSIQHKLKFRKLKTLSFEGNDLTDYDLRLFCNSVRKGCYKQLTSLNLKKNRITELGLLQLCILLEEGYCPHLIDVSVENNPVLVDTLAWRQLSQLLLKNMKNPLNQNQLKLVTTYQLSNQHMSVNSKVILQMFTKLTAKWNQLSRQMKLL